MSYDLIVIGGGPAGYVGAIRAALDHRLQKQLVHLLLQLPLKVPVRFYHSLEP